MAESYPCPRCAEDVPTHMVFSGRVSSGPELAPADRQHAECKRCKAMLYRVVSIPDQSWRLDPQREQAHWSG